MRKFLFCCCGLLCWAMSLMDCLAEEAKDKTFRSMDGSYSFRLDTDFVSMDNPLGLSLFMPSPAFFIVCVDAPGTNHTAEQMKQLYPKSAKGQILASHVGEVGGRPAAYFVMEGVFEPPTGLNKKLGLAQNTSYQTVTAIIPGPKKGRIFQAHYPKPDAENARKLALAIFNISVAWHK